MSIQELPKTPGTTLTSRPERMAMHGLTPPDGGDGPGSEAAVDMDHHVVGPDGMIVKTFSTKAAADKFAAKNKWHRVVSTPKGTLAEPTDGMED